MKFMFFKKSHFLEPFTARYLLNDTGYLIEDCCPAEYDGNGVTNSCDKCYWQNGCY